MAARTTDPAVGASTCASGSQVWTGHIGNLTENEGKNQSHRQDCIWAGKGILSSTVMSVVPAVQYMAMIASSISTEPVNVKRKNLKAAYTRFLLPQMPMMMNIGMRPPSKKR